MTTIKTAVIQIGNSDNKLDQCQWSAFVEDIQNTIDVVKIDQHFFGGPPNWAPWQNVCWAFTMNENNLPEFKRRLARIRAEYNQDSVALVIGETEFV